MIIMLKGRTGTAHSSTYSSAAVSISRDTSKTPLPGADAHDVLAGPQRGDSSSAGSSDAPVLSALLDASLLSDRHKAFEVFRQSYRQGQVRQMGCCW